MAKVHHRKARKDYPDHGIEKGDMYYFCQIKTGPRSSRTLRSLTPFKQSQLTSSPFKQAWFAAEESFQDDMDNAEDVAASIREAGEDAQSSFENMPEGLQQGDTGQMLENRFYECETAADSIDELYNEYETLDEPIDDLDDEDQDYQTDKDEYDAEIERLVGEVNDILSNMPE